MQAKTFGKDFKLKLKNFDLELMLLRFILTINLIQKATNLVFQKIEKTSQNKNAVFTTESYNLN